MFHSKPGLLSTKHTKFRNDAVHQGKIPTDGEALSFGNAVLNALRENMLQSRGELGGSVRRVVVQRLQEMQDRQPIEQPFTVCANAIVSLSSGEASHHQGSLEQHLVELRSSAQMGYDCSVQSTDISLCGLSTTELKR